MPTTSRRRRDCRPRAARERRLQSRSAKKSGVLLDVRSKGTHWKREHGACVALLQVDDGWHQPQRAVRGVQINRRGEMSTVRWVLDDVFTTGVASGASRECCGGTFGRPRMCSRSRTGGGPPSDAAFDAKKREIEKVEQGGEATMA
eukprot:6190249-Pleurochrysis_carterae.AAC.2